MPKNKHKLNLPALSLFPPPSQPALSKYGTNYFKYFFSQYNGRFSHSLSQNCSYLRLSILPLQVGINFFSSLALFPPML